MTITLTLVLLASITFTTRYLFLHPQTPMRLSARMQQFLSFSAPAVLTAIWVPIIIINDNKLNFAVNNPYLWGAIIAILVAWKSHSIYLTALLGGGVFILLHFI